MSNWGKEHENNSIDWGQGSDNTIGWGIVYDESYSGDTVLNPEPKITASVLVLNGKVLNIDNQLIKIS